MIRLIKPLTAANLKSLKEKEDIGREMMEMISEVKKQEANPEETDVKISQEVAPLFTESKAKARRLIALSLKRSMTKGLRLLVKEDQRSREIEEVEEMVVNKMVVLAGRLLSRSIDLRLQTQELLMIWMRTKLQMVRRGKRAMKGLLRMQKI